MKRQIKTEVTAERVEDKQFKIRPSTLSEYIGQAKVKTDLKIALAAAKKRNTPLGHTLFYGQAGLGKTTLAEIIAHEMGVNLKYVSAPQVECAGDICKLLSGLLANDILFIDEIHRLDIKAEEVLYSAMEDGFISIIVGKDSSSHPVRLALPPFTLIGATTKLGQVSKPLTDRFINVYKLESYSEEELREIAKRTAGLLGIITITDTMAQQIATCSRKTPRLVNRYVCKYKDYLDATGKEPSIESLRESLSIAGVKEHGLTENDTRILKVLKDASAPVGVQTLAGMVGEDVQTIESVIEPYLLMEGYIQKTGRGRILTEKGAAVVA